MTNPTPHGQVPAIQRYKIGYHSDEWGVRSSTPGGIYDDAGPWVRYEDHADVITALRAQQPAPATQQAGERVYAFRRKGLADFCTCDEERYEELSSKPHLFETRIFYTAPQSLAAPATQQAGEVRPVTPYTCPKCHALWLHWPAEQTGFGRDTLNCRSADHCHYCEKASVEQLQRLERIPAALHAPQPMEREPLTDEWIRSRCKESWIFDAAKQWVRMTEVAHGIKGGQHER